MRVSINKTTCSGCGTCQALCLQVFELGEDGKAQVKEGADLDCCNMHDVSASCPTGSIEVED
ncbi:MAG: ferredoxin [Patescibacteria group bacterium]|nr:ferredoxin [Patescibacteria group bacterium]